MRSATRIALFFVGIIATTMTATAQTPAAVDPEKLAIAYQYQQCQSALLQTGTWGFALAAKLEAATKRADAENKRADEAGAKLRAIEKSPERDAD